MRTLRSIAKRLLRVGISARFLIARARVLRLLGMMPASRATLASATPQAIFFSFPYHSVGDTILSLTLLDRVHKLWPLAAIDVAASELMAPLIEAIPYVRTTFHHRITGKGASFVAMYAELYGAAALHARKIASTRYDLAIAPRWDSKDSYFGAHLAYLTGAPVRCGYAGSSDGGPRDVDRYYTHIATGGAHEHESLRYLRLLGRCGMEPTGLIQDSDATRPIAPLLAIASGRRAQSAALAAPLAQPFAVLSPGATGGRRMWHIERYAAIARNLFQQSGIASLIVGGPSDVALCEELCRLVGPTAVSTAGQTNVLQMVDLIAQAALFVGNDSGPAHIAGGLGIATFVVSPFAASCSLDHFNSPRRFRPAGPQVVVIQPENPLPPCDPMCTLQEPHCILQVSVEDVWEPMQNALREMAHARTEPRSG